MCQIERKAERNPVPHGLEVGRVNRSARLEGGDRELGSNQQVKLLMKLTHSAGQSLSGLPSR